MHRHFSGFAIFIVIALFWAVAIQAETVIEGQVVRDQFAVQTASSGQAEIGLPIVPEKEADVVEFARFLAIADQQLERINLDQKISLTHKESAKLLGLLPITYTLTLTADPTDLSLQVRTPWWLWLTANQAAAIRAGSEQALGVIRDGHLSNTTLSEELMLRQKILLALLMPWRNKF
ncbi:MAG: hypothetical protein V1846_05645 [Candidatus Komeilibacteria bacterium]